MAEWMHVKNGDLIDYSYCSNCGYTIITSMWETDFCPKCWARMDGE